VIGKPENFRLLRIHSRGQVLAQASAVYTAVWSRVGDPAEQQVWVAIRRTMFAGVWHIGHWAWPPALRRPPMPQEGIWLQVRERLYDQLQNQMRQQ
jgi:hypothetical protein